jgi:hypothetical protein
MQYICTCIYRQLEERLSTWHTSTGKYIYVAYMQYIQTHTHTYIQATRRTALNVAYINRKTDIIDFLRGRPCRPDADSEGEEEEA